MIIFSVMRIKALHITDIEGEFPRVLRLELVQRLTARLRHHWGAGRGLHGRGEGGSIGSIGHRGEQAVVLMLQHPQVAQGLGHEVELRPVSGVIFPGEGYYYSYDIHFQFTYLI